MTLFKVTILTHRVASVSLLAAVVLSLAVYVYLPQLSHAAQPLAMAQPRSLSARLPAALSQFTHDLHQASASLSPASL